MRRNQKSRRNIAKTKTGKRNPRSQSITIRRRKIKTRKGITTAAASTIAGEAETVPQIGRIESINH